MDHAIHTLAHGHPIPEDAVRMARKAPIPSLFFLWVANYMTRKNARRAGLVDIGARPHAKQP